jgi:dolichol-phosphate mannosyltransferase
VIVVTLFIGGIQLLCLAIIGAYLGHMYEEVKARPPFIVESVINPPGAPPEPSQTAREDIRPSPEHELAAQERRPARG